MKKLTTKVLNKNLGAMALALELLILPLAAFGQTKISMPKNKNNISMLTLLTGLGLYSYESYLKEKRNNKFWQSFPGIGGIYKIELVKDPTHS